MAVGEGRACGGRGAAWAIGARTIGGGGSVRRTPHLASPLKGERDELGNGWIGIGVGLWGRVCSCLRRNDGEGAGVAEEGWG